MYLSKFESGGGGGVDQVKLLQLWKKFGTLNLYSMYILRVKRAWTNWADIEISLCFFFSPGPSANFKQRKSKPRVRRL